MAEIDFLNVDLEFEGREPLDPVLDDLGEDVVVMYRAESRGMFQASIEIAGGMSTDADSVINRLCDLVERMEPGARAVWDRCVSRMFDVGYDSGDTPRNFRSILQPATIARVASLGGSVAVTIYPLGMPAFDVPEAGQPDACEIEG